jgi:hypothetical protein
VFAGLFGLRDSAGSFATIIGSTLPALVLIGVGRTMSRRAAERRDAPALPQPATPTRTSSAPPIEPPPAPPAPPPARPSEILPRPARSAPAPEPVEPIDVRLPPAQTPPKSSQEMIEEARKRWGSGPPNKGGSERGL